MVTEQARDYYSFVGQLGVHGLDFGKGIMNDYDHSVNIITINNSRSNSVDSNCSDDANTTDNNNDNSSAGSNDHSNNNNRISDCQRVEQSYFDRQKTYWEQEILECAADLKSSDIRSLGLPVNGFKDIVLFDNDDFVAICDNFVKLYSTSGDLLHKIELASTPISMCRVGERRVAVTCTARTLRLISVHIHEGNYNDDNNNSCCRTLVLEQELSTAIQYCSVSQLSSSELIAIGLDTAVLHRLLYMPTHLEVLSTLPLEQAGKLNIRHQRSYRRVCVSASKQIIISDRMNNFLLGLSTSGTWKIPFFYKPQGMVVAGSFFYVIQGGGLNLVYRFGLNGLNAFCLLRKKHELLDPWGLSINRNKKLVITCNTSGYPTVRLFT